MDEIILAKNGARLHKQVDLMGATESVNKSVSYGELNEEFDLRLNIERIEPFTDDDGEFAIRIELQSSQGHRTRRAEDAFNGLPPVPDIARNEISDQRRPFYDRLKDPQMQPYDIRRIIYEEGELTERRLRELLNEQGHTSIEPGKQHGGLAVTLVLLDEDTGEIERIGRGEEKTIRWVGAE